MICVLCGKSMVRMPDYLGGNIVHEFTKDFDGPCPGVPDQKGSGETR